MASAIGRYFGFDTLGTNYRREVLGGLTTFITTSYIIVVNPKILEAAGMPFGPSMVATIVTACVGTLAMGVYARRPFAIAPYMVENAFVAYTVVQVLGYSWQTALGAIFIGGILFTLVSVLGIRRWLAAAIPDSLKIGFAVGIGLFLAFLGLNGSGVVALGIEGAPVQVGDLSNLAVLLALGCFLLTVLLMVRRVGGALLIGILATTAAAYLAGVAEPPTAWISTPPDPSPILLHLDIAGALTWGFFPVILTVLVMDFVDTTGTLLGLSYKAGLLDDQGELPGIQKPMVVDSLATVLASLLGTTTSGVYIESAAGIEAGARSGFASVVTGLLFLLALFFAPFLTAVPACAYAPALIVVGLLMMSPVDGIKWRDLTEAVPAFTVITLMTFTMNLGVGMTAGFVAYPLMKLFAGRANEVKSGMWVLAALSALFFLFYPY